MFFRSAFGKHPENEFDLASGLQRRKLLAKYPKNEFGLASGVQRRRPLAKYAESEFDLTSGVHCRSPLAKYLKKEFVFPRIGSLRIKPRFARLTPLRAVLGLRLAGS